MNGNQTKYQRGDNMANLNIRLSSYTEKRLNELVNQSRYDKTTIIENLIFVALVIQKEYDKITKELNQEKNDCMRALLKGQEIWCKYITDMVGLPTKNQ